MATISIFIGSVREGRIGDKVAKWVALMLEKRGHTVRLIDPLEHEEILTVRDPHHRGAEIPKALEPLHEILHASDGFILVTPEYNHSFSGVIKNAIDNFLPEYEKKPFGIVSYSGGPFGGIRAAEGLRVVVPELRAISTPIAFVISGVHKIFDEHGKMIDPAYEDRIGKFLDDFEWYVAALKSARDT